MQGSEVDLLLAYPRTRASVENVTCEQSQKKFIDEDRRDLLSQSEVEMLCLLTVGDCACFASFEALGALSMLLTWRAYRTKVTYHTPLRLIVRTGD